MSAVAGTPNSPFQSLVGPFPEPVDQTHPNEEAAARPASPLPTDDEPRVPSISMSRPHR